MYVIIIKAVIQDKIMINLYEGMCETVYQIMENMRKHARTYIGLWRICESMCEAVYQIMENIRRHMCKCIYV